VSVVDTHSIFVTLFFRSFVITKVLLRDYFMWEMVTIEVGGNGPWTINASVLFETQRCTEGHRSVPQHAT